MTTPKVSTIKRGGARFYVDPDNGQIKVPGVTSIIGMLPKEFLRYWAAKEVAQTAVDSLPTVLQMILNDQSDAAVDFLKKSPDRNTRKAADTGTAAHDLFERMSKGETLGRVHPDLAPFVQHFDEFLKVAKPEYHFMEETVWSDKHGYAGSFDAFAEIGGERLWIDNKTTRSGIHEEVGIQLAAYRFADSIIRADGGRVPMPQADGGAVLHVRPEGWKLVPVRCDEALFEVFLHLREVFRYEKEIKGTIVGREVFSGPADAAAAESGPKRRAPRARKAAE
ncbi:exonuclease [Arthrobacter phage DrManhattan]|uniref:Exonuclease n=2 Tax=Manhattanvirus drmanhattan TaxID=2734250 RepID=A0A3G2KFN6_9CAUD|nr:exonuclease [Arthrobacter phage DrManhattan]AYN57745.1 exonuclease [Arthrobacter phage DrManhattan]QHB36607.1 exonuclease [Arthrobacter phage Adolin]